MTKRNRGITRIETEGGCHCGAVRFRLSLPLTLHVRRCNCSICRMTGYRHMTVARDHFELLRGKDRLEEYRFNTGVARHRFCRTCGIKSFYVPRSHPEAVSVHLGCVDLPAEVEVLEEEFDGANWSENVDGIRTIIN